MKLMKPRKHKWLICAICKKWFFADPRARNCKRPACKEVIRVRNLKYQKKYQRSYRPDENRYRKYDTKRTYKLIPCLKCRKNFKSEGKYNRLCDPCRRENGYISDEEVYSLSSVQKSAEIGQE